MNWIVAIPFELRVVGLFVLGGCFGSLANLAIYRLAWHGRPISPWSTPDPETRTKTKTKIPDRRLSDRMPIWGWLGLRREVPLHGPGFWIRPMLVELLGAFGLAALYWWEVDQRALLPAGVAGRLAPGQAVNMLHAQFAVHTLLVWLMIVASLIDIDEKTIPDTITVPGTLIALLAAALYPWSLLPEVVLPAVGPPALVFLRLTSPNLWPGWLGGFPHCWSLAVGLGCWWLWCVGLMQRVWYPRHGWARAFGVMFARLGRESSTWRILLLGLLGSATIGVVWLQAGQGWIGLLSALVGVAAAAGLVWAIRLIGAAILKREAMGFGDVTLMAMIGGFLGWQAAMIIFFLAPLAALAVGLVVLVLHREREIPYGPFLCLATLGLVLRWAPLWDWAQDRFALGLLIPVVIIACLGLLAVLLALLQLVRRAFR